MSPENKYTPAEIKSKYPYMFSDQTIEASLAHGWIDLFAQLCDDLDAILGDERARFSWIQVKEKFGSARFYWKFGKYEPLLRLNIIGNDEILTIKMPTVRHRNAANNDEALMKKISELADEAERLTRETCIACAARGQLDSNDGYLLVLCPEHAKQRAAGTLANFWFDPDE